MSLKEDIDLFFSQVISQAMDHRTPEITLGRTCCHFLLRCAKEEHRYAGDGHNMQKNPSHTENGMSFREGG